MLIGLRRTLRGLISSTSVNKCKETQCIIFHSSSAEIVGGNSLTYNSYLNIFLTTLSSLLFLSWDSSRLQVEENQPSPHLTPGLSPGLKLLAGLGGQQLLAYFHRYIALVGRTHVYKFLFQPKITLLTQVFQNK